jgi:hypothetical protein
MGSSAQLAPPARGPAPLGARERRVAGEESNPASGVCRERKRSQSKPLKLSAGASKRCARFLEIEAIGAIWLAFEELRRNRARFPGAKDRHAPGFWASQPGVGAQGLAPLLSHVPGFIRNAGPRSPMPQTILECPLDSMSKLAEAIPRAGIGLAFVPVRHAEPGCTIPQRALGSTESGRREAAKPECSFIS